MSARIPKLIKLEKKYSGIIAYCDILLDSGQSLRNISELLISKYHCCISYESIRIYADYRKSGASLNKEKETNLYYRIAAIRSRR